MWKVKNNQWGLYYGGKKLGDIIPKPNNTFTCIMTFHKESIGVNNIKDTETAKELAINWVKYILHEHNYIQLKTHILESINNE